ncbi:MAG: hypothetical protein HY438_01475 [DPANN group archaeon]|nr:hypothetical protein [DPANN group archaeon]
MLAQNPLLLEITKELAGRTPDEARTLACYQRLPRGGNTTDFVSEWAEALVRANLEEICAKFASRVQFDTIAPGAFAREFIFERRVGKNLVVSKFQDEVISRKGYRRSADYSDIDELLLVDGLPVLFEIKASEKSYEFKYGRPPNKSSVKLAMRSERISYLLKPIREFFHITDCAYVLVVTKDFHRVETSPLQASFVQGNGIIVPLHATRDELRTEAADVKQRYGL